MKIAAEATNKHLFYNARIEFNHWNPVKFILDNIFLIAIVLLSGGALLFPALTQRGKKASPSEVTLLINRGKAGVLDVRAKDKAESRIIDSKHIPLAELGNRMGELDKFKNKTLVVCDKGISAFSAARMLEKSGFSDVVVMEGGIDAWKAQNLPLTRS
jgi:rhodanese-related sulfurtransferase